MDPFSADRNSQKDRRRLQGFVVAKKYVGSSYVKEYRDFIFGKPLVSEGPLSDTAGQNRRQRAGGGGGQGPTTYTDFGRILVEVYDTSVA